MSWRIAIALLLLLLAGQLFLTVSSWKSPSLGTVLDSTTGIGLRLRPCPETPNCVCSHNSGVQASIDPLTTQGDADAAFARLRSICEKQSGFRLMEETSDYLRFSCTSPLLRYVDDLEFLLDRDAGQIHVRSASRVGRSDLGTNRRRVEMIRQRFESDGTAG